MSYIFRCTVLFGLLSGFGCYAQLQSDSLFKVDDINAFKEALGTTYIKDKKDSLLLLSVNNGTASITEYLLETGASVEGFNSNGDSPLHLAVSYGHTKTIELLLANNADPNLTARSRLKGTPLMYAVSQPNLEVTKTLIDHGAGINAVDKNGDPALNWATYNGNIAQMQLLIDEGADLRLKSKHGDAVDVALRLWHADSVVNVFRRTPLYEKQSKNSKALINAVISNDWEKVKRMLDKGVSPDQKDGIGNPMLQIAAQNGNVKITETLLESDADPNIQNRVGQTPLAFAARFGQKEIVDLLLQNGADVNLTDDHYRLTPLIGAAISGDITIGEKLLKAGAEIDHIETINQCSALHWGLFYGRTEFVKMLLDKGARHEMKVLDGRYTDYSLARFYNNDEIIDHIDDIKLTSNAIMGSWKFSEIHYIYKDTTYSVSKAYPGTFIVTPKRYAIMYNPSNKPRQPFVNLANPSDEEVIKAFQSIVFNSGQYELTDSLLVTRSDIARVPGFEGGRQYFNYTIDNSILRLKMFDETYPNGDKPAWYGKLEILFILERE